MISFNRKWIYTFINLKVEFQVHFAEFHFPYIDKVISNLMHLLENLNDENDLYFIIND